MKTVGVFSAIIATWQASAIDFQAMFGTMPESVGMLLWGVSLLALAGAVRHRRATDVHQGDETTSALTTPPARSPGMLKSATVRFINRHSSDPECALVR